MNSELTNINESMLVGERSVKHIQFYHAVPHHRDRLLSNNRIHRTTPYKSQINHLRRSLTHRALPTFIAFCSREGFCNTSFRRVKNTFSRVSYTHSVVSTPLTLLSVDVHSFIRKRKYLVDSFFGNSFGCFSDIRDRPPIKETII